METDKGNIYNLNNSCIFHLVKEYWNYYFYAILLLLLMMMFVSCTNKNKRSGNQRLDIISYIHNYPDAKFRITKIVDGDTFYIEYNNSTEKIRFIGMDTPESSYNSKLKADAKRSGSDEDVIVALGKLATAHLKSLVNIGDSILLELDLQPRDRYKRILAYSYLPNGEILNERMLRDGFAQVMNIQPNVKYQKRFLDAQRYARENGLGLWKTRGNY